MLSGRLMTANNRVEFRLQAQDDEEIVEDLIRFFHPIAIPYIEKIEPRPVKSWDLIFDIVLMVVGWGTGRFILDPLVDNRQEWLSGIRSVWSNTKPKRQFRVTVNFEHPTNSLTVQMSNTRNEEVLSRLWDYVGTVHRIVQEERTQGLSLDKIRILPDGTDSVLVIGYENNRPKYTIDLTSGVLQKIKISSGKSADVAPKLFFLEQLIRRLEYLQLLVEQGYNVPKNEIPALIQQIESERKKLESGKRME